MTTQTGRDYPAIDWLRMPLAVCVIFIHSFGTREVNYDLFLSDPWSWESVYNTVRIFLSSHFPVFAVPTFFLISGFFFFRHLERWNWQAYGDKLRKRVGTILLPYIFWNLFHCVHLCWPTLMKIAHGTAQWDALWRLVKSLGGWHMLWTGSYHTQVVNVLGITMVNTAPVLVPMWFLRDLMVVILFVPLLHWLLRKGGRWFLALLGTCLVLRIWIPLPGFSTESTFWFSLGGYFMMQRRDLVADCYRIRRYTWAIWPLLLAFTMWVAMYRPDTDRYLVVILQRFLALVAVPSVIAFAAMLQHKGLLHQPAWLAKSAFWVYCSHIFLRKIAIKLTLPLVPHANPAYLAHYLLVPFLTLLLCLATRQLWVKVTSRKQP